MSQKPDELQSIRSNRDVRRTCATAGMDAWSKMMIQLVNTEAYAQATGAMLDAWLTTSAPFRKAIEATMTQVLTQLNMPTRSDVTSLAERLTNIEMRLDDLEAKLDESQRRRTESGIRKAKDHGLKLRRSAHDDTMTKSLAPGRSLRRARADRRRTRRRGTG